MSADREAAIREALDLGLQAWRNTDVRETFHAANDSLNALLAELAAAREGEAKAEREAASQMGSKLEAQMALKAITDALDLKLSDLGNGWTEGVKVILTRIQTVVDEASRGFRERDESREREAKLREALREAEALRDEYAKRLGIPLFMRADGEGET